MWYVWILIGAAGIGALLGIIWATAVSLPRVIRAYREAVREGVRAGNEDWEKIRPKLEQRFPFLKKASPPSAE